MNLFESLAAGDEALGERLLPLGSGPIPVAGARTGMLALAADGSAVLVVVLGSADRDAAFDIADHLDRLSRYSERELASLQTGPDASDDLAERHEAYFDAPARALNHRQRAIVIVDEPPPTDVWKALVVELGPQLSGVYRSEEGVPTRLEVPTELTTARLGWFSPSVIALIVVALVCAAVVVVALAGNGRAPSSSTASSAIRIVALDTQGGATNSQWIGQQHMVRTSQGALIVVYPSGGDLQIVSDRVNQGRSWTAPATVRGVEAASISMAIDATDRLHVAFNDGSGILYTFLERDGKTWRHGPIIELDGNTSSPVVDIAWDEELQVSHVVWARDAGGDHEPRWAAVSFDDGEPEISASTSLARAGDDSTVLVNVAVDPGESVIATYRKADPVNGWYSRSAAVRGEDGFAWEKEKKVPTGQFIGAADVAMDRAGTAHLILRDSSEFQLLYSKKLRGQSWTDPEIAVDAEAIEQVDFPSLSVDLSTELVYVFFQSNQFLAQNEIRATVRDPASGWAPAFPLASAELVGNGAAFPSTMGTTLGMPLVIWTTTIGSPAIQIANVVAP
jgi:hypothetical protein